VQHEEVGGLRAGLDAKVRAPIGDAPAPQYVLGSGGGADRELAREAQQRQAEATHIELWCTVAMKGGRRGSITYTGR
jgi:hypothetical protein